MWHRYAKRTIGWLCPSSSRCKEVQGQLQRDWGSLRTLGTCEKIERGTYACKASKLWPVEQWWTQIGKLGITIQETPQSPEDGHIYYILLIRIASCRMSINLPLHYLSYVTMNIYFRFPCQYCMWRRHGFAYIWKTFITLPTHFHIHIQRHTHISTHVKSAHKRNGDNQVLVERGGRKAFDRDKERSCTHTKKMSQKTRYSRI